MAETTTILNISQSKIGTSCMICGQFIEFDNLFSSRLQICDDCKETVQFVKQNRSKIENILKKVKEDNE